MKIYGCFVIFVLEIFKELHKVICLGQSCPDRPIYPNLGFDTLSEIRFALGFVSDEAVCI